MKLINKLVILSLALTLGLSSCKKENKPTFEKEKTENKDKDKNKEDQKEDEKKKEEEKEKEKEKEKEVEKPKFAGYTFVLDQSQIPTNGGYAADDEAPQAKLMAFDPNGEVIMDVLAQNNIKVDLGFDSELQKVGDYLFIFAKKSSLKDNSAKSMVTVLNANTLEKVSQIGYTIESASFNIGATPEKAFIGVNRGAQISVLDLKTGTVSDFTNSPVNSYGSDKAAFCDGYIFVTNNSKAVITWYDMNNAANTGEIALKHKATGIYKVADDTWFVNTDNDESYLLSLKDKKVIKELPFRLNTRYYLDKSLIYDQKNNRLYFSGKHSRSKNRDKIFFYDLSQNKPEPKLFYTVPAKDINKNTSFRGNIMMGINYERDEMYIGHLATQDFVSNPKGGKRAVRVGYLSKIVGLSNKQLPITAPDATVQVKDMGEFSSFFFNGK